MAGCTSVIVDADPALTRRNLDRLSPRASWTSRSQGLFDPGSADLVRKPAGRGHRLAEAVAAGGSDRGSGAGAARGQGSGTDAPSRRRLAPTRSSAATPPPCRSAILRSICTHSERFLGVHFSNPAPFIPGVELIAHAGHQRRALCRRPRPWSRVTGKLTRTGQRQGRLRAQPAAIRPA